MPEVPYSEQLDTAFGLSFEKQPTSSSWGFFAYDDAPLTGGGAGNFSWFDSKDELLKFLKKFPMLAHSAVAVDTDKFEKAGALLAGVTAEKLDQDVVDRLNKIIAGIEQIQWFGQLNELLSDNGEFPEGLRTFFSGSSKQISKTQIPEFAEFLRNWGH